MKTIKKVVKMPGKSMFKIVFAVLLMILVTPYLLQAGYVLTDADGSKTFISKGKMKFAGADAENSYLVVDNAADRIMMVDGTRKFFAAGTVEEYCRMMKQMAKGFEEIGMATDGMEENAQPSVEVIAAGQETIAGIAADKYKVMVDGDLYEELWLTGKSDLTGELGKNWSEEKFLGCLKETEGPVENSKAYSELSKKGWVLRSISHAGEQETNTDVVALEQKMIPDSEFTAPDGYRKLKFEEFLGSEAEE